MKITYVQTARGLIQGEIETTGSRPLSEFQFTPAHRLVLLVDGLTDQEVAKVLRAVALTIEDGAR